MFYRTQDSKLTDWFFEIDRNLFLCILGLISIGIISLLIAGSVSAERISQPWHFFFKKSFLYYVIGLLTFVFVSMLNKKWIIRLSFINFIFSFILLILTMFFATKINNSLRWINLGFLTLMPSDIMKPGFIIIISFLFSKMKEKYDNILFNKETWLNFNQLNWWYILLPIIIILFIMYKQPDIGNSIIYIGILGAMFLMVEKIRIVLPIVFIMVSLIASFAYFFKSHFTNRLNSFWDTGYQLKQSIQAIQNAGLFGKWNDAFVKQSLPDSHTDFIFAAITEDFGAIIACLVIGLFLHIILRLIKNAIQSKDIFTICSIAGVVTLFGLQISINLGSALGLIPPKGTTLPFISYGGSAFVSFCFLFGLIIAIIREDRWKIRV